MVYELVDTTKDGVHSMKKKILILSAVLLAVILAVLLAFLLLYGPSFGIFLRKPSPQDYGARALAFMENGYYSSAEVWREAKASTSAMTSVQKTLSTFVSSRSSPARTCAPICCNETVFVYFLAMDLGHSAKHCRFLLYLFLLLALERTRMKELVLMPQHAKRNQLQA